MCNLLQTAGPRAPKTSFTEFSLISASDDQQADVLPSHQHQNDREINRAGYRPIFQSISTCSILCFITLNVQDGVVIEVNNSNVKIMQVTFAISVFFADFCINHRVSTR